MYLVLIGSQVALVALQISAAVLSLAVLAVTAAADTAETIRLSMAQAVGLAVMA
jgi:hypothetical protein